MISLPRLRRVSALIFILPSYLLLCAAEAKPVTWPELSALPLPKADQKVAYGPAAAQAIDVRQPSGKGLHPVALLLHGGCWSNQFDSAYMSHWADALRQAGWATFNIEYRRIGDAGGGWPGTFDDIKRATDFVLRHAAEWQLDPRHVIIIGHSAGGHLALLLAAQDSRITAVVGLAAITDLTAYQKEPTGCAEGAREFVTSADLRSADPMQQPLPARAQILLFAGSDDTIVPPRYAEAFAARSPNITVKVLAGAGHFDLVSPTSAVWTPLLRQVSQLQSGESARPCIVSVPGALPGIKKCAFFRLLPHSTRPDPVE